MKLNIEVHYSDATSKYHLNIWTGDVKWFLADDKDRLYFSSSYSAKRITKRRIKQEKKWTARLAAKQEAIVFYTKEV